MINSNFSLASEFIYERNGFYSVNEGRDLTTQKLPIEIKYFNKNGLFANLGMIFVQQELTNIGENPNISKSFILADTSIGFRLPNKLGIISLEMRNMFNKKFIFDDKWRIEQSDPLQMGRQQEIIPTRTILARVIFNY